MNPILYSSTETEFINNGIGILTDAITCSVTEERNGMFELEMQYPMNGIHYESLVQRALILAKPNPVDDAQPFRIYRITRPLNGVVTVYAEHISYDLSGIPVSPFKATNVVDALSMLKQNAAVPCPFTFWTDKETVATMNVNAPDSIRGLLGGQQGSILDTYTGEYKFDRFLVRLYNNRGQNRGVSIRYGKNLTELEQEEDCSNVYTGVYPYWRSEESEELIQLPEKIIHVDGTFNFERIKPLDFSQEWQEKPTEEQLRSRAERYIKTNELGTAKLSLDISFAQLEQAEEYKTLALLERVELCDTVNIYYEKLGVNATAKVIKTVYDVILGRYDSVELGDSHGSIADTIAEQEETVQQAIQENKTTLQRAVDRATQQITGNLGGYVVLHSSTGSKEPDEILIMDEPDVETAVKVWRWNKSGLGYSSHGYNGSYGLAMTQNGEIVADFIKTGVLNANLITTGTLSADRIKGGTLYLGGSNNTYGTLIIRNSSNSEIGRWDRNGISVTAGTITSTSGYSKVGIYGGTFSLSFNNEEIGYIGTAGWKDIPSVGGIWFALHYDGGDYMTWAAQDSYNADYYTVKLLYAKTEFSDYAADRLYAECQMNFYNGAGFGYDRKNPSGLIHGATTNLGVYCTSSDYRIDLGCVESGFRISSWMDLTNSWIGMSKKLDMRENQIINTSDERLKTNIEESTISALDIVNSIGTYSFDWIYSGEHEKLGLIAQQLEAETDADFVDINEKDEHYSIKPLKIIPYLIKAIQELSTKIEPKMAKTLALNQYDKWIPKKYTYDEKLEYAKKLKSYETQKIPEAPEPTRMLRKDA